MKIRKIILFFALLLFIMKVNASLILDINETGKIINYYTEYYVVSVKGNISITNTFNDTLYSIRIPYDPSPLVSINYKNSKYLLSNHLLFKEIKPNETIIIPYKIVGVTQEEPQLSNHSLMYKAIMSSNLNIYYGLKTMLQKANLENKSITGNDQRLITVKIENPASIIFRVKDLVVIKTDEMNPNIPLKTWDLTNYTGNTIPGNKKYIIDFLDSNAHESEIYWLSYKIYTDDYKIKDFNDIVRINQDRLLKPEENKTINKTQNITNKTIVEENLIIKKYISKKTLFPGDVVNISIVINNLMPKNLTLKIVDVIPDKFRLLDYNNATLKDNILTWRTSIGAYDALIIKYKIMFIDNNSIGIDFLPKVKVYVLNKVFSSDECMFIKKYIPNKKIYLQKKISYLDDDSVKVNLKIKNLGLSAAKDITLREYLADNEPFTAITKTPLSKGVWFIDKLNKGETWEVSYVTSNNQNLMYLPDLFANDNIAVFKTIILENIIKSKIIFFNNKIRNISIILILIAIVFVLFEKNHIKFKKMIDKEKTEIDVLKIQEKIDKLKNELNK